MKKILLILLLLPCFASAQIETYLVSPYGNIEFDSARVMTIDSGIIYVTPSQLSDSLATVGGGTDTNALTTNTPMSSTLDTVQRNGVNSALSIATNGVNVNGYISTSNNGVVYTTGTGSMYTLGTGDIFTTDGDMFTQLTGNIYALGTGGIYTTSGSIFTQGVGSIYTSGTGNISTTDGNIIVNGVTKRFIGQYLTPSEMLITDGSKNIVSAPVATYPSLTELTYLKGVTSDIQTQINGKQSTISFGTGVQTALGINIGSAGAPVLFNGALGTPSSGTLTNATGLPQSGVTNLTTDLGLKAPLANPTFTGTVTIPTPFTLGATSVTSTGTQLNYLSSATGTTGTTSTNLVYSTSPTLVTPNLGTPSTLVGTNITGTASGLTAGNVTTNANLTGPITSVGNATSIASQTGTGTKFVVDNTPTLITPILGVASATSLNTGTTLNGTIFAKSANVLSLASTNHALTAGNEASGVNLAIGLYSTSTAIQARSNGASSNIFMNPLGGTVQVGDGSLTGQRLFSIINTGSGTGDWSSIEVRNAAASTDAIRMYCLGTGFTTSGTNVQDAGVLTTGTNISGGMSIGTQASAGLRFYTNNILRTTIDASGHTIHTARVQLSKGANVASAGDLTLGSAGNSFSITGTTTINAITTTSWQAGSVIRLIFASTPTVKHNTAGGASTAKMLLNGGVDFVATANDVLTLIYDGTNWLECSRSIN